MKIFLHLLLFFFSLLFFQCKKYDSSPEAFFIKSKAGLKITSPQSQGSACSNITDLFLYVDGQFQGAYPTGNLMPIVSRGKNVTMDVFAGVKNNGIKGTTVTFLLYDKIELDTLVEKGKTFDYTFNFKYAPGVQFPWLENFENPGFSLVRSTPADTFLVRKDAQSFEGYYAMMPVDASRPINICESSVAYALPKGNSNLYLQFTYKCDAEFVVGVTDGSGIVKDAVTVTQKSEWNTIYIQLANVVSNDPQADKYKVFFRLNLPTDAQQAHVWLDNIKIIYI